MEKKLADDVQTPYKSAKTFKELGLKESLLEGIFNVMKFEKPSKIQAETLPMILEPPHRNLIAQAHNGSGKTTCFVLGMLSLVDPEVSQVSFVGLPFYLSIYLDIARGASFGFSPVKVFLSFSFPPLLFSLSL